jgi:hypothetical protein
MSQLQPFSDAVNADLIARVLDLLKCEAKGVMNVPSLRAVLNKHCDDKKQACSCG